MKLLQELTALSIATVHESIKELDLTLSQNRAIEREISDLLSAGKSQDIDVEVHHVQDEGDCYKAFYTFEDPKTGKDRHGSIYFKARILDHSVEDFEEKTFNEGLALKEGRGPQKKLWTILLHPEDGAPGAKPYPKAQVNKLVKYLSRKGVVNVLQNDAKNLKLHVAFNDSWTEDSVWDMIQSADLDDALSWGGSVRAAKKLAEDFEEKSFNEGLTSESRSFREEPIPPFAVCYSYDGVVHKDDVFMGSRKECLEYMRTHKAKKPFTFDLMDTDSGRLVSYSLKEAGRTFTIKKSGVAPHGAPRS